MWGACASPFEATLEVQVLYRATKKCVPRDCWAHASTSGTTTAAWAHVRARGLVHVQLQLHNASLLTCGVVHRRSLDVLRRVLPRVPHPCRALRQVVGGELSRLGSQVVLASLPLHPLYIVDIMIYPSQAASFLR